MTVAGLFEKRRILIAAAALVAALVAGGLIWRGTAGRPNNVIIFVADGLRSGVVTPETAPELAAVRAEGVDFQNSHSLYPTVTTPNASAIATGHRLGDTGDFGNALFVGAPLGFPVMSPAPFIEDNAVIGLLNQRFGGNFLNETSLLEAARAKGYSTAAIGKLGPVAIQSAAARDGKGTIVLDDAFPPDDFPLPADVKAAIRAAGLQATPPDRGLNSWPGTSIMPGVRVANVEQQDWFTAVATKVLLPRFKAANKPFVMVFWSRDPDGTQHNQGDSLNTLAPGINGPTAMAAIRNASKDLGELRKALKDLGLDKTTNIVVTADHGFSTVSKASATSGAAKMRFDDVPAGFLPPGFLAIDLGKALGLPIFEPNGLPVLLEDGHPPHSGSALLGADPAKPKAVIAANGGSDLIYLPDADAKTLAPRVVEALTRQDYVAAIFVDDALGAVPGALPLSAISLKGSARTPTPSIVVSFRSFQVPGCPKAELCAAEVADTTLQQGQGIHGAFSRADTHNFMAAVGPDFRKGFVSPAPVSNADWAITLARLMRIDLKAKGELTGRVMSEALKGGRPTAFKARTVRSQPAANGFLTVLNMQEAAGKPYYDAAGAPGRTVGLKP
ncbi:MAG: alkaline phosphatase family protein [Caulobacteraceae bacterium]|nr:alkaline phosphatase family protein [Caulobacteraceae bacterium]